MISQLISDLQEQLRALEALAAASEGVGSPLASSLHERVCRPLCPMPGETLRDYIESVRQEVKRVQKVMQEHEAHSAPRPPPEPPVTDL